MSAVNLGASLGGVSRAMASATGAWVTGYESNPELAEAGMELSTITGLAKRAPIQAYDPAAPSLKRNSCNAIVSVDSLHTIPDKPAL
ncbi:MAG: class I SAM-dependent methyltransferase [Alphaproteobacteria bacterium]|nr:class I SAM-dependent methyltransferase [Alphaproteobacteria bacterium]